MKPFIYGIMKDQNENAEILLGRRIRSLRNDKGWTQQELGDNAGVNYKFIGEIERGQQNPSLNILLKISAALQVDLNDLFRYEHELTDRQEIEKRIRRIVQTISAEELNRVYLVLHALFPTI